MVVTSFLHTRDKGLMLESVATRLEIQLLGTNTWSKLVDEPSPSSAFESFLVLLTKGSSKLDAILLRATCPYLFEIWANPMFISQPRLQSDSKLLLSLDENLLGVVFSYFTEHELAFQVAPVCTMFRACIVSTVHLESLLGGAMSTGILTVFSQFALKNWDTAASLSDRLEELASTVGTAFDLLEQFDVNLMQLAQTKVERTMVTLIREVPDCSQKLKKLAFGLIARNQLRQHNLEIGKLIQACEAILQSNTPANHALNRLLCASIEFGQRYGTTQPQHGAFTFTSLLKLHEIKSRFHRKFTAAEMVLLLTQQQGDAEIKFAALDAAMFAITGGTRINVLHVFDAAKSTCNKVHRYRHDDSAVAVHGEEDSFHARLGNLFCLFDAPCHDLLAKVELAQSQLAKVSVYLFSQTMQHAQRQQELVALRDFTAYCLERLQCEHGERAQDMREYAWKATALEVSAVAKNASQRAQEIKLQPETEKSSDFLAARNLVNGVLGKDTKEEARQAHEERMYLVSQSVISSEEREARRLQLESTLQLRVNGGNEQAVISRPAVPKKLSEELANHVVRAEEEEEEEKVVVVSSVKKQLPVRPSAAVVPLTDSTIQHHRFWKWTTFAVTGGTIWNELAPTELSNDDIVVIDKLFSRGPEVHLTVGTAWQTLKHFTSEDFAGVKTISRDRNMVDLKRSTHALNGLPQDVKLRFTPPTPPMRPVVKGDNAVALLVLPLVRILELKHQGKLSTLQLHVESLEMYLSDEEFASCFHMPRADFAKLPAWKRDKLKKERDLF